MWITPKDKSDSNRSQSKLDRFFDQQSKAQALVRESIQNSFDALLESESKLTMSFTFKKYEKQDFENYMKGEEDSLYRHLKECGINTEENFKKSLLIEDYNTEGLSGPIDKSEWTNEPKPKPVYGNFIGFWWSDGISEKSKGSGGSHGVGKITLSTSSDIKTFYALSKRNDDNLELLIGYSQLKYHYFDRKAFQEHSRYGKRKKDGIFPYDSIDDDQHIKDFKQKFGIDRKSISGTSILIPSVNNEITFNELIKATLREYFMPILNESLNVIIKDGSKSVDISNKTIYQLADEYFEEDSFYELVKDAELVLENIESKKYYLPKFDSEIGKINSKRLAEIDFEAKDLEVMKSKFNNGHFVGVLVPVEITESNGSKISSRFYLFLKKDEKSSLKRSNNFIRDKLLINKESLSISRNYSSIFLYIQNKDLSEFLKYAEDPGHERWLYKTLYENGGVSRENDTPLRLIKSIVVDLFNILSGIGDDEKIKGVLPEIFSIKEKKKTAKNGKKNPSPPQPIISKSVAPYVIGRLDKGYTIKNSKELKALMEDGLIEIPFNLNINLRYEKISGVKNHTKYDFDLREESEIDTIKKNVEIVNIDENQYKIKINNPDFSFKNIGFDEKRDLVIKCKVSEN